MNQYRYTNDHTDFQKCNFFNQITFVFSRNHPLIITNLPLKVTDNRPIIMLNLLMTQYSRFQGLKILGFLTDEFTPKYSDDEVNIFYLIQMIHSIIMWCDSETTLYIYIILYFI